MTKSCRGVLTGLLCALILAGWGSSGPSHAASRLSNAEKIAAWDKANAEFIECNRDWQAERRALSPQFKDIVVGSEDPRYLQSLTSETPVSQEFKDALLKFRAEQVACRNELFVNLGETNIQVKLLYRDAFQSLDMGMADVLSGKLKTMGEVNRAYAKWVDDANDARILLRATLEGH